MNRRKIEDQLTGKGGRKCQYYAFPGCPQEAMLRRNAFLGEYLQNES